MFEIKNLLVAAGFIIVFGAKNCSHCQHQKPELVAAKGEGIKILEIDVDQESRIANTFKVKGTPTTLVINDRGRIIRREDRELNLREFRNLANLANARKSRVIDESK
jgi:thiol-disulfide isomerase/thioredoxin